MPQTPPWPFLGQQRAAWTPPGPSPALAAVPLTLADLAGLPMTRHRHLELLTDRLAWMLSQEDRPLAAAAHLAAEMQALGCWEGPSQFPSPQEAAAALLLDNPEFPRLLALAGGLTNPGPWTPHPQPKARAAIEETSLTEWLDLLTPATSGLQ